MTSSTKLEDGGRVRTGTHALICASAVILLAWLCSTVACGANKPAPASLLSTPTLLGDYKMSGSVEPVRDPSMMRQGNTYYLFSTDDGAPVGGSLPIRCSEDLVTWSDCGHVFDQVPAWVLEKVPGVAGLWAPDISYFGGEYHLYYVGSIFGTNQSVIGLATNVTLDANDLAYSWVDHGEVLNSTRGDDFNALDPNIFVDSDGSVWLTFGSFWSGIKQAQVNPATGMVAGSIEQYSLAGRPHDSPPAVEAPFVVHHGNFYYLFVSFGLCCAQDPYQSDYRIMVGRGTSVHGPFLDENGMPMLQGGGTQLLAGTGSQWNAPGGQSVVTDPATGATTIVFHAHQLPAGAPFLFVNALTWNNDWPQIEPQ